MASHAQQAKTLVEASALYSKIYWKNHCDKIRRKRYDF